MVQEAPGGGPMAEERGRHRCTSATHPPPQDLVDGGALLQRTLGHHVGPHLFHIQHESV